MARMTIKERLAAEEERNPGALASRALEGKQVREAREQQAASDKERRAFAAANPPPAPPEEPATFGLGIFLKRLLQLKEAEVKTKEAIERGGAPEGGGVVVKRASETEKERRERLKRRNKLQ